MTSKRPAKRCRNEDSSERSTSSDDNAETIAGYVRGEPWLEDGNMVLVAENMAFRVLKSILSRNSEIFRDMFTISQPQETETLEGCPVVQLHDSKEDLECILSILFDIGNTNLIGQLKLPLVTASAMLRLGSKYQIAFLRQDAIRRLERSFPSSLALFSNRFTINRPRSGRLDAYEVKDVDIPGDASCIAVVRLARTYNLPHLLPPALFMCAQLEPSKLVGGWVDSNDVSWTLSQEDLARCLKGEKALINYSLRQQQFVIEAKPSPICTQGPACASNLASEAQSWLGTGIAPSDTNCLSEDTWIEDFGCCSSCERYFKRLHNYSRETAWNNLARVFDLEMAWPPGA